MNPVSSNHLSGCTTSFLGHYLFGPNSEAMALRYGMVCCIWDLPHRWKYWGRMVAVPNREIVSYLHSPLIFKTSLRPYNSHVKTRSSLNIRQTNNTHSLLPTDAFTSYVRLQQPQTAKTTLSYLYRPIDSSSTVCPAQLQIQPRRFEPGLRMDS